MDYALLQKRNDRQAAAKDKSAGFGEKQKNLHQHMVGAGCRPGLMKPSFEKPDCQTQTAAQSMRKPRFHPGHARTRRTHARENKKFRQFGLSPQRHGGERTKIPQRSGSRLLVLRASL